MSKGLDIWGRQRRLRCRDDGPEELATTTKTSTEEDEPEVLTTTTEASAEEAEETTHPSERLQRQWRRFVYGIRLLMMKTASLTDYDGHEESVTTTEASAEEED